MYTWDDLKKLDGKTIPPLSRKKYVNIQYGKYSAKFRKSGTTLEKYIMDKILNDCMDQRIIITPNKFPYDLAPGITHLTIWINPLYAVSPEEVREYLHEFGLDDFVLLGNLPENKSLKQIEHYHLFILDNDYSENLIKSVVSECF